MACVEKADKPPPYPLDNGRLTCPWKGPGTSDLEENLGLGYPSTPGGGQTENIKLRSAESRHATKKFNYKTSSAKNTNDFLVPTSSTLIRQERFSEMWYY